MAKSKSTRTTPPRPNAPHPVPLPSHSRGAPSPETAQALLERISAIRSQVQAALAAVQALAGELPEEFPDDIDQVPPNMLPCLRLEMEAVRADLESAVGYLSPVRSNQDCTIHQLEQLVAGELRQ